MNTPKIIIKFEQVAEQTHESVKRLVGFVMARHMLGLFDAADLEANPRSAKSGSVTHDIIESIEESAPIFPFKTKGVLIGSSDYRALQRNRYEIVFDEESSEGILDGGHNMLAIGTQILSRIIIDDKEIKKIRLWDDFRNAWSSHRDEIEEIKEELDFLVPLEILVPSNLDDEDIVAEFKSHILDICAARNNNAELTVETRANQKGFYDEVRRALPKEVANRIEWKTNDGGEIKVRDVIALSWIPLSLLDLQLNREVKVSPQNIYRNKGECTKAFDQVMGHSSVSLPQDGGYVHTLHNPQVISAIKILADLPGLYDKIYMDFPEAYNRTGGQFGRIGIVKMFDPAKRKEKNPKYVRTQPYTHFTNQPCRYRYPDGMIMPLVYGVKALMQVDKGGVKWIVEPKSFLDRNLEDIADAYKLVLEMSRFDPQKIGKNETSYKIALNEFEKALLKETRK